MSNVSTWTDSVRTGVGDALHTVVAYIPQVLGAIVVLVVGVIVAYVLKAAVVRLLRAIKIKSLASKVGWNQVFPGEYDLVDLLGDLVKWFFIIVFLLQALSIANLLQVTELVRGLLAFVPKVFAAAVVVLVGAVVADLTSRIIVDAARVVGATTAKMMGAVAQYAIWAVVFFTVLAQLGVNTTFLDRLFTAIVAMLAIAGGVAFGLGGRDLAHDVLEGARANLKRD